MENLIKTVVIVGPTGCGKTKLSIYLSQQFNGEIISADAMQIYKVNHFIIYCLVSRACRLLLTKFLLMKWKGIYYIVLSSFLLSFCSKFRIPHHCINFVHPKNEFNSFTFSQ